MRDESSYIRTFTGRQFWPLDPRPEDVDIRDIAHALAFKCRYGGHSARFYSVAEHSVRMAAHATPINQLATLLHDAGEAYLPDVARPVKPLLVGFKEVEAKVDRAIAIALCVEYPWPEETNQLDVSILTDEMMALLPYNDWDASVHGVDGTSSGHTPVWRYGKPLGLEGKMLGWNPEQAEGLFLQAYNRLRVV